MDCIYRYIEEKGAYFCIRCLNKQEKEVARNCDIRPPDAPPDGVGAVLQRRTLALGAAPCQLCSATAAKMDRNGVDWCEENLDSLVDEIHSNAKKNKSLLGVYAKYVPGGVVKMSIAKMVKDAIIEVRKQLVNEE